MAGSTAIGMEGLPNLMSMALVWAAQSRPEVLLRDDPGRAEFERAIRQRRISDGQFTTTVIAAASWRGCTIRNRWPSGETSYTIGLPLGSPA